MTFKREITFRLREWGEDLRWAVRDWSAAHPPRTYRLIRTVLTPDEAVAYIGSVEYRTAGDYPSDDAAVAAWLLGRGEGDRVPPELREAVKIRLDPEGPE